LWALAVSDGSAVFFLTPEGSDVDIYCGFVRTNGLTAVECNGHDLDPYGFPMEGIKAPAEWEWGQEGPGTDALAFALLHRQGGQLVAKEFYLEFAREVLAQLPRHAGLCWTLTAADLCQWLMKRFAARLARGWKSPY
jgi:hypothetical protein